MAQTFIGSYRQQPRETLEYTVDYSRWLGATEVLDHVDPIVNLVTNPPLVVGTPFFSDDTDTIIRFRVGGGVNGNEYQVTLVATTSLGQVVEREILYTVDEA